MQYTIDQLKDAFVAPLRSALLLDNAFPRYIELLPLADRAPLQAAGDYAELRLLLAQCEDHGLLCEVENRFEKGQEATKHAGTSDLLILDYHLVTNNDEDAGPAHRILREVAESPHANLVVVYTAAPDLAHVKRCIAAFFRGVPNDYQASLEYEQFAGEVDRPFSAKDIDAYLRTGVGAISRETRQRFSAKLKELEIDARFCPRVLRDAMTAELQDRLGAPRVATEVAWAQLDMSEDESGSYWLAYKNVFIVIVPKGRERNIFDDLLGALQSWNPSPLQVLLVKARAYLEQDGFLSDWRVLSEQIRQTGFVYLLLTGEDPSGTSRMRQLFRNVFGDVFERLMSEVVRDCSALLTPMVDASVATEGEAPFALEQRRIKIAAQTARAPESIGVRDVLHELNVFLSSTPFQASYLKTGTLFEGTGPYANNYWVCVTADCDLVPRSEAPTEGTWEHEVHPYVPILALRLKAETGGQVDAALDVATRGRHLFVRKVDGTRIALRIADEAKRQPSPEVFLWKDGKVDEATGAFHACKIATVSRDNRELVLGEQTFMAIAQLRPSYADRIITQTGHHTSRIGVDFVNSVPTKTAGVAEKKATVPN